MPSSHSPFGTLADGRVATLFSLTNGRGLRASVSDYGATLVDLQTPDRAGNWGSVILGYPTLEGYVEGKSYLGAVCGRFANRIDGSSFSLGGRQYRLTANEGENHLHGGGSGFDRRLWSVRQSTNDMLVLEYCSPDKEEGYPGNLRVRVSYRLLPSNALQLDYWAATDKPTPVNLTHHAYFNLAGGGDVLGHQLQVHASRYLPTGLGGAAGGNTGPGSIPTGELASVTGTPFDLRRKVGLNGLVGDPHPQVKAVGGFDHNFLLDRRSYAFAARVNEPTTGRAMTVFTDQPGLQVYTGNYLDGQPFPRHGGLCLETQHFPDSPNHPHFPSTILMPGQIFRSRTVYGFALELGR